MDTVLVVAPWTGSTGLPNQADEAAKLTEALDAVLLQGPAATEANLIGEVERLRPLKGLWFATHGSESGIAMADRNLSPHALAQHVARSGAEWVVLNACHSEAVTDEISRLSDVDLIVVDSRKEVQDADAYRQARYLAGAYRETGNIREAYRRVGGAGNYRAFWSFETMPQQDYPTNSFARLEMKVDRLNDKLEALVQKVNLLEVDAAGRDQPVNWSLILVGAILAAILFMVLVWIGKTL